MDILFGVVSKILEPIIAPITAPINRHIGYVFQLRSNVDGLRDKVKVLVVARDSLQCSIEAAEGRAEEVEKHVIDWRKEADTAIREAQTPLQNGQEEAQRGCSLRLATRYRISKKAAKTTAGIAQLLEQKRELGETIARPGQLHQIDRPVPVECYEAKSRTKILKKVMGALLNPSITMVGVYGMGGIGKTTLAEEVQRQVKTTLAEEVQRQTRGANSSFDQVIIVTVTATPEVKGIQDKIAGFLRESNLGDDIEVRASRLHKILENKKVLIIMDDLWSVLEPYKVGIPSWNDGKGCKLLLTSRNEDILSNMGSQKNFPLRFLSEEESWSLFEMKVDRIHDHDIAEQILAKCDGFPLLIVTVGALLRNKPIHYWENAVTQLCKFQDGEAVKKVHSVLESSYNNLDDEETKQIFLLIGISLKSDTTVLNLLRYALGLGLFRDHTLREARNGLIEKIDKLKACSLLEDYELGNLKMHDLVRETAIRIARMNKYAFRERDGKVLKEWPSRGETSRCTIVSVPQSSDIRQLPGDLGCPDVELLLLYFNLRHPVDIPDSTFEGTRKLKVIHFARMELASLPIRPPHSLANLHTLCLEDCSLLDLTTITQLERLEILSLRGSDLEALPREIGKLTRMKVLDLSDCSKLISIPLGVISKLTSLEELLMRNSFDNWEVEEEGTDGSNARLSELKCLPRLESSVIGVPDTRALSKDFFDHLERFQILIGRRWGWWRPEFDQGSEITKTLKLVVGHRNADLFQKVVLKLKEICIEGRIFKSMSFKYLASWESLRLSSTRGVTTVEVSQLENMPLLRKLSIRDLRITRLWTSGTDEPSSIRIVELERVSGLRHVWRPESQMDLEILKLNWCYDLISLAPLPSSASFRRLSTLELCGCDKVTDLVNPITASTMANLVTLKVSRCHYLEEIVAAEERHYVLRMPNCIVFHKLKTLELLNLESIQGFCICGSYSFKFPCLEEVSVSGCPAMSIFCYGEVSTPKLHNVGSLPLWASDLNTIIRLQYEDGIHIRDVRLSRYPELVYRWGRDLPFKPFRRINRLEVDQLPLLLPVVAVPSNVLPALSTLQVLVVKKCDSVEEIFDLDGMDHQNEDHVHFMSKLRVLELYELPKLNHTWNKDPLERLGLKNLEVLKVHQCGTLTHILTLNVALGLVLLRELYVGECPRVKVIIEQQSDEQPPADGYCRTIFQFLEKVQLENLPSLMRFYSGDDVLRCPELTSVRVEGCPGMSLLGSTALSTEKDESIIVQRHKDRPCDVNEPDWLILNKQVEVSRLEELTVKWNSSMGNAWHEIVPQFVLHRLQVVKLTGFLAHHELFPSDFVQSMPNLREFSIADSLCKQMLPRRPKSISDTQPAVSFKMLTCLELFDLPKLSHLVEEDSQSGSLFQHLETLKVSKCKRLTRLITFIMAKGLVNLEKLVVEECERMTEVVSSNGEEVGVEIVFWGLKSLELHGLPCLASFSSGDCTFNFPRLDEVIVRECPSMRTFARNAPSTPKLDYVQIAGEEDVIDPWRLVEAGLNGTMEKLFAEKIIHEEITIRRESSP